MSHRIYKERNNKFANYVARRPDNNLNPGNIRITKYEEKSKYTNPFMLRKQERLTNHSWHYMTKPKPKASPQLPNYLPEERWEKNNNIPLFKNIDPFPSVHKQQHPLQEYRYLEQRHFKHY